MNTFLIFFQTIDGRKGTITCHPLKSRECPCSRGICRFDKFVNIFIFFGQPPSAGLLSSAITNSCKIGAYSIVTLMRNRSRIVLTFRIFKPPGIVTIIIQEQIVLTFLSKKKKKFWFVIVNRFLHSVFTLCWRSQFLGPFLEASSLINLKTNPNDVHRLSYLFFYLPIKGQFGLSEKLVWSPAVTSVDNMLN